MEHCTIFSMKAGRTAVAPTAQHYFDSVALNGSDASWTTVTCASRQATVRITDLEADDPQLNNLRPQMYAWYSSIPTHKPIAQATVLHAIHDCQTALGVSADPGLEAEDQTLACIFQLATELEGMVLMPTGALYRYDGTLMFDTAGQSNLE